MNPFKDPIVSIIVPCLDGIGYIPKFEQAIKAQSARPESFEIIVVDNGSQDGSLQALRNISGDLPLFHALSYNEQQSSYAARNYGISEAVGEIFAFTDIDCMPAADWIEKIIEFFRVRRGKLLLSGRLELFPQRTKWNPWELYDAAAKLNQGHYSRRNLGATANLSVRRRDFLDAGGFETVVSGGDILFCEKALRKGIRFQYSPEVLVYHPARSNAKELIKKEKRIGIGTAERQALLSKGIASDLRWYLRTIVALLVQMHQWRLIIQTARAGKLRFPGMLIRFAGCAFLCGATNRVSALRHFVKFRRYSPSVHETRE